MSATRSSETYNVEYCSGSPEGALESPPQQQDEPDYNNQHASGTTPGTQQQQMENLGDRAINFHGHRRRSRPSREERSRPGPLGVGGPGRPPRSPPLRAGPVLNRYLYLSGRVDMRQVERTVHHLLRNGMQMLRPSSPYHNAVYGSFQERATFISHTHTAKQAARHGDRCLAKICGVVAADEKRHETAYTKVAAKVFEVDPDGMVRALAAVLRDKITMPGQLMTDGRDADLFEHFSAVAQRTGVYTARDYGDMVEHFVRRWKVADLGGGQLSGEGRRAQEYVCGLPRKIRRVEELAHDRAIKAAKEPEFARFSWVFDRSVCIRA